MQLARLQNSHFVFCALRSSVSLLRTRALESVRWVRAEPPGDHRPAHPGTPALLRAPLSSLRVLVVKRSAAVAGRPPLAPLRGALEAFLAPRICGGAKGGRSRRVAAARGLDAKQPRTIPVAARALPVLGRVNVWRDVQARASSRARGDLAIAHERLGRAAPQALVSLAEVAVRALQTDPLGMLIDAVCLRHQPALATVLARRPPATGGIATAHWAWRS